MKEYTPSTILPPLEGTTKFGGTQSRIIMGGVNVQNVGTQHIPCIEIRSGETVLQYGLQSSDDVVSRVNTPNIDLFEIGKTYSLLNDNSLPSGTVVATGVTGDPITYDVNTGILTGVSVDPFAPGTAYWCHDIITLPVAPADDDNTDAPAVTVYLYTPTTAGRTIQEVWKLSKNISINVESGKAQLAASISSKGIPSTIQDSLTSMGDKVRQIQQVVNTGLSDFDEMVMPSEYEFNVYHIAKDLMETTLPDYFPAYLQEYKAGYGANAHFVGEYYRGYDTLELTGADGYLTCDGDFYTIAGEAGSRVVTHTLPDGTVETYEAESIIHTWHDVSNGKINRYIVFFYLASAWSFTNSNVNICPRRTAICGTCNSFIITTANRLTDVYVIGTLVHFEGGMTGTSWSSAQVMRNYREHSYGSIYTNFNGVSLLMPDLERSYGGYLLNGTNSIEILSCPKLVSVNYADIKYAICGIYKGNYPPKIIHLDSLKEYNGYALIVEYSGSGYDSMNTTIELSLASLEEIKSGCVLFYNANNSIMGKLQHLYLDSLRRIDGSITRQYGSQDIWSPYWKDLIDVKVGALETNLFTHWNPTNVIADPAKLATLNENIRNHIAARVSDRTGQSALTFTVSTNLYNNLEQATKDAFTAKNWNVAGA